MKLRVLAPTSNIALPIGLYVKTGPKPKIPWHLKYLRILKAVKDVDEIDENNKISEGDGIDKVCEDA